MTWVRMHAFLTNWPATASSPVLEISSDSDGEVVLELAWDPQALLAPAVYPDPLRYYTTAFDFNATRTDSRGASSSVSVPAQSMHLNGGVLQWSPPAELWAAYVDEARKSRTTPPSSPFACNLYYRVRLLPGGADQATIWPTDEILSGDGASAAPHIGILANPELSEAPPLPDAAAVKAAQGTSTSPTVWADAIEWCWTHLGTSDVGRAALAAMFAHPRFKAADLDTRADLLRLWLCAGAGVRPRLSTLLDLVLASGRPALDVPDLHAGKTLLRNLLDLLAITPHPDLVNLGAKEHLVDDVLTELLDPNGQVDQPVGPAVSPSGIQALLAMLNPAEFTRLQAGWLGASGSAVLANGDSMPLPAGLFQVCLDADPIGSNIFVVRTNAELAFEGALLAYGQAAQFPQLTGDSASINAAFQAAVRTSLTTQQAARVLSALFGVVFTPRQVAWPPRADDPAWLASQSGLADSFLTELATRPYLPLVLFWSQPPSSATDVTQALLAVGANDGTVTLANPTYAASRPPISAVAEGTSDFPPRVYQDPTHRLESMSTADLGAWILGYLSPASALV